jgi:5-methyltetrahydrofolate--homocysteine methyltransferase
MNTEVLDSISENVVNGKPSAVEGAVRQALKERVPADAILNQAMIPAMTEVGTRFEHGDCFVPEMVVASRAMQAGLDILRPELAETGVQAVARVAIGTIQGDLHNIGKNLVAMMWEGAGFDVIDLGTDVRPEDFVKAVRDGADLVGISALITTTMTNMSRVPAALSEAGLRDRVKVLVGGAPLTQDFADRIGADGYAPDASQAVKVAKSLLDVT